MEAYELSYFEKLERETGLEPATSSLGSWHSTTELLPHSSDFYDLEPLSYLLILSIKYPVRSQLNFGTDQVYHTVHSPHIAYRRWRQPQISFLGNRL